MDSKNENFLLETLAGGSSDAGQLPASSTEKPVHAGTGGWSRLRSRSVELIISDLPSHNTVSILTSDDVVRKYRTVQKRGAERAAPMDTHVDSHVDQIVGQMEADSLFMKDNPFSEQLRTETLREMPEPLTLKRSVRRRLVKTVSQKSSGIPLSLHKRFKYRLTTSMGKVHLTLNTMLYSFELWYHSLKVIEGHFGSSVATYFRFLRSLFLLNCIVFFLSFGFVVVPQLLMRFYESVSSDVQGNSSTPIEGEELTNSSSGEPQLKTRSDPYASNGEFSVTNLLTGAGFLTNTTLYYGHYSSSQVSLVAGVWYNMPSAYFFTMLVCYLLVFVALSVSMAVSYRKSFIETAGGLKNVFAHKVFCGWDFSIATQEAANLKSRSILVELKELLSELAHEQLHQSCLSRFATAIIRVTLHTLSLVLVAASGFLVWYLLAQSERSGASQAETTSIVISVVVTLLIMLGPIFFSLIVRYEQYSSPRTDLVITLLRTFVLEVVIVGVLVLFWLQRAADKDRCWETSLGQEVYRLILVDFLIATIGTAVAEFARACTHRFLCKRIGAPEFDVARNTLNLIYNQTLFFVGFYFSPLLSAIIVIKMFIMFYVRKVGVLVSCVPSHRSWRAAQVHTLFLCLAFLSLLGVFILYGYIITSVEPSEVCGPFRGSSYMYEMILTGILHLQQGSIFWNTIFFLLRPGVVALALVSLSVTVYYMRAKAHAHGQMVSLLREMLQAEAKDKDFLLTCISQSRWLSKTDDDDDDDGGDDDGDVGSGDVHWQHLVPQVVSSSLPRQSASTSLEYEGLTL